MKKILVATDFSPASLAAADYAAAMASVIQADLYLLHVYVTPLPYGEVAVVMHGNDMEKAQHDMKAFREKITIPANTTLNMATEVVMGVLFEELKNVCEYIKPSLVVMGTQGTTAAERFFLGGNSIYAARHLQWPLVTVPAGAKFSAIKKIGLACDFDHVIETIPVDEVKHLVKDFNAELHVLNVGKQTEFDPEVVFQSGMLQEMLDGSKAQYHFITAEDKDQGLIDFAESNHIDLLVAVPKRHGLLDKLLHKSHTKQLILHSHVPVMVLHPQA